jgi:4-amino-4-deoxy-L-arabinose transferase-like glycosyltransferase
MAFPAAQEPASPTMGASLAARWKRLVAALEAYPLERIGLAAIAAGIVLRLVAPLYMDLRSDGDTYAAMGHVWSMRHEFLMPWGDVTTWGPAPASYSNHYPPAYPLYLGIVFTVFGFGLWQAKLAAVAISLAALAAVYVTTRDLYGKTAAALAGGLIALEPGMLWVTGAGFSENMVLLFFALTMWAILRSLRDDRYILLAGLFAGLAYLSRASVGYFFVIAGGGGFLWRFYYRRWRLFTNVWYMGAIAIFLGIAIAWGARNVALFGYHTQDLPFVGQVSLPRWETSSYTTYVQDLALQKPDLWRKALLAKIPFFLAFGLWYALAFPLELWKATKRIREEETSALWLSVVLVWVIAWVISAMFWVFEQSPMYWLDNHRYILIGILPLAWLVLREAQPERASFRMRYAILAVSLFVACAATFTAPVKFADLRAAEHMDPYLQKGDEIAVDGNTIKYAFYPYLHHPEDVRIYGWPSDDQHHPQFIITLKSADYGNYTQAGEFRQVYWNGGVMTAKLLVRNDVLEQRHIPTGLVETY